MDEELRGLLVGHIENVCQELAKKGSFAINEAANQVIDELRNEDNRRWKQMRDHFAEQGVV
jgi:NOL1/NOP2/fmu family ribosome biogenesis protein